MRQIQPVFRFAPSPNGPLHLGHGLCAVLNHRAARVLGGRFLLRIEDIDPLRSRESHIAAILEDLRWLGLDWEEPVRRQSQHLADYGRMLEELRRRQLVYPCFCSRREVQAAGKMQATGHDPDGAPLYAGTCKLLPADVVAAMLETGQTPVWRLDMAAALRAIPGADDLTWLELESPCSGQGRQVAARAQDWGDAVLARRDVATSYHLSVVCDDALQGVTHVVRGQDLFQATGLHRLLQVLLGLPAPAYHHHRLLLDAEGQKLAKSRRSSSLADLRAQGASPSDVMSLLGLSDPLA